MPVPPASGWDLTWPFPTPPVLGFDRALPGYVGPFLQSLTPLGGGGVRRSAPWPPPRQDEKPELCPQPEHKAPSWGRACVTYEEIPEPQSDPATAAQILASRLVGDPRRMTALCAAQPPPEQNHDALHLERLAVYRVLREDAGLRYHVDRRRFFRTLANGESCELLSLARASQVLRQGQAHLKHWLRLLPYEQHLFTPPPPAPPRPARRAVPAGPKPSPTQPPTSASASAATAPTASASASAATAPTASASASAPAAPTGSASKSVAATPPAVPSAAGPASAPLSPPVGPPSAVTAAAATASESFTAGAASVQPPPAPTTESQAQAPQPQPAPPAIPGVPFLLKIHRYWDLAAGAYCEVAEVLLEGDGCDEAPWVNADKVPAFLIHLSLPLGSSVKVTVTWANGLTRSWEEKLTRHSGIETEIFSPDG